jgi:hypothetical protein
MNGSNEDKTMMVRRLQTEKDVLMQAVDFSPLTGGFHVISPHFSATRIWFLAGCEQNRVYLKQAEPAHNSNAEHGIRNAEFGQCQGRCSMRSATRRTYRAEEVRLCRLVPNRIFSRRSGRAPTSGGVSPVYRGENPASTEVNRRKPRYTELTEFVIF